MRGGPEEVKAKGEGEEEWKDGRDEGGTRKVGETRMT